MPYHSVEDPTKLRRVLEAVVLIERDLELSALLCHVIEEAASMTGARYGALGVLNDEETARAEFITAGLEADVETQIGPRPNAIRSAGIVRRRSSASPAASSRGPSR